MTELLERWISPTLLGLLSLASLALLLLSMLTLPWVVSRLPEDFFVHPVVPRRHWALTVLRNTLGGLLFVVGVAMLVLPGQGVLTIVVALLLVDLPYKRVLLRRVVRWRRLMRGMNAIRRRMGVAEFALPEADRD